MQGLYAAALGALQTVLLAAAPCCELTEPLEAAPQCPACLAAHNRLAVGLAPSHSEPSGAVASDAAATLVCMGPAETLKNPAVLQESHMHIN